MGVGINRRNMKIQITKNPAEGFIIPVGWGVGRFQLTFADFERQVTQMVSGLHPADIGLIHFPPMPLKSG